jgi:diaminohydroxyphosphoribosylaminopyrimidine deaminase/5-amino-6-(5-phosphoribosylamino)uracil reductase
LTDEEYINLALNLAKRGKGKTSPNPMVGAIIVKDGKIVGKGYHKKAGKPHAEINALRDAGEKAKEGTLYINLEPCVHYGKTPPCTDTIIKNRIKRVVIGMKDPNPVVSGKGIKKLKKHNIDVSVGILEEKCRRLNEVFCKYITTRMPFVILKAASTLDGKIATKIGNSKWITSEKSREYVHRLRNEVDGILVGIETLIKDNPLLTTRIRGGKNPIRIIVDTKLRIPIDSKVLSISEGETIIATTSLASKEKIRILEDMNIKILLIDLDNNRVDLLKLMKELGKRGITSILLEGGSKINGSFIDKGIVDKVYLFFAPKIMGGRESIPIFSGKDIENLNDIINLRELNIKRIDRDILISGYIDK